MPDPQQRPPTRYVRLPDAGCSPAEGAAPTRPGGDRATTRPGGDCVLARPAGGRVAAVRPHRDEVERRVRTPPDETAPAARP
ncbi:hypothetical protein [Streptomyces sp. NPDC017448]|uniref:hypothetical protein n=1 Tax=Streptomyces sp. NPDC017448 TaxID=3364996 RepID=UPI0037AE3D44